MTVMNMNCVDGMRLFPDAYFDSIVTDPPYELGFMGKAWDASGIANNVEMWREALSVLKPAHEPIVVARKPLVGTVAANVLAHGTGAINIDGCRVDGGARPPNALSDDSARDSIGDGLNGSRSAGETTLGRWPANLIHDGSDEVLAAFPQAPGQQGDLKDQNHTVPAGNAFGQYGPKSAHAARVESSTSAARFFYCAKTSKSDRSAHNTHPTVKPTDLMRYLCRLVTPPGGLVLDPFTGSGSTWKAVKLEGFRFIGFELSAEYCDIAMKRIMELNA